MYNVWFSPFSFGEPQTCSRILTLENGNPQGSILSPTLFNITVLISTLLWIRHSFLSSQDRFVWASFHDIVPLKLEIDELLTRCKKCKKLQTIASIRLIFIAI